MKKDERIAILKQHDDAQAAMDGIMLGDAGLTTGTNAVSKRTKHCDTASRAALDSKQTNAKSNFWQEVRESYVHIFPKTHERNLVMFDDELFRGIDPSVTKPHPPEKLFAMAKELTQKYFAAEQRFTKCGQHENEFRNFVENQGVVLYLRKWLKVRRNVRFTCWCTERGALSQRSQLLNILGDIRRHLGDIDKSIVAAANDDEAKDRLLEDRAVLLEERKSCIERLRTNTN
ncbi:uncharacterized protein KRP23_14590 [Phytophthora ramorum]|uniref:uncharacterized protein n=1 Tax=Phytophthora ramorum TaxID=164328 RepID=UPI0030A5E287|nr:hypothetical protein KRP23_14590 [Phytophthora ramorum]